MNRASESENFISGIALTTYPQSDSLPITKSLSSLQANASAKIDTNTITGRFSSESKEEMSNNSRVQILVVDDDAMSRKILAQLLTSAGYQCSQCEDGAKALEIIHAKPAFASSS